MGDLFQPTHLLVIGIVLIVLFGGRKLPELGKGLGEGLRGFREGLKGEQPPQAPQAQQTAAPVPPANTETKQS
jgi:sec-independent protein translocase protein TatA